MENKNNQSYYILALAVAIGLLFHGASFFSTLQSTYDVFVHMFFADHYSKNWFDPWEPRWYTGFNLISYPPLLHQLVALFSFISGLKFAAFLVAFGIVILYVSGSYRFAKLITANKESAGYAALIAVFLPSVIEAFHVFGQLPMMLGISWLLHSLPEIYKYIRYGKVRFFFNGISLIAVGVCSHHVTPIFGMVFFVLPLMGTAIMDGACAEAGSYQAITVKLFIRYVFKYSKRIIIFGLSTIVVAIFVILPYWLWSKSDPITQVPIPHGSRDNFIEIFSSGLTFFILPYGFLFLVIPYFFYRYFSKRNLFMGLSFTLLVILGTGGTTPIPIMLLGENAFNILTLERFTFWATIYAMPLTGEFLWQFTKGSIYRMILTHRPKAVHSIYVGILVTCIFLSAGFTMNLNYFRPLQPEPINIKPIKNFLQSDKHYKWKYLTLGFGDQMAWLSANTNALTIDGNYHSARRIPELTTRAIERLENAKYKGTEGVETLKQFLSSPETFNLKFIFSNDKFYDPILFFSGWHRVKFLSNGIMVWERSDVSTLPSNLPKTNIPLYQKIHWGVVPLLVLFIAFFCNIQLHWLNHVAKTRYTEASYANPETINPIIKPVLFHLIKYWIIFIFVMAILLVGSIYFVNLSQVGPEKVVISYYDALDFKRFEKAHSLLDPETKKSLDYFLLESSVTDGLIDSYGKINNIRTTILEQTTDYAKIETEIQWVTPLEDYTKTRIHEVKRKGLKWYMMPIPFKGYIPTNQFTDVSANQFINQGRRKVTAEETFHEDVLDRPVVYITDYKMVKKDRNYHIVGQIQNLDNFPVDITINADLIDSMGNVITSYGEQYHVIHKLLPKEITSFRIDFDEVKWRSEKDSLVINPLKNVVDVVPSSFNIKVLGTVATQDLYKSISVMDMHLNDSTVAGHLYNFGAQTVSVSEIILSYFDKSKELIWVDVSIAEKSTFPKKSNPFNVPIHDIQGIQAMEIQEIGEISVNGLPNESIIQKYQSRDRHFVSDYLTLGENEKGFLRVQVNNFVGNPSPF